MMVPEAVRSIGLEFLEIVDEPGIGNLLAVARAVYEDCKNVVLEQKFENHYLLLYARNLVMYLHKL